MDPLWMFLLLVLVGSEALNITEVKAVLGQDVNLTCSIDVDDIYWYLEVHFNFRVGIGRTFSQTESNYFSPDCESKYVMSGNQLLIKNVSLEDIRLYYCGRKNNRIIVYGDVFRLHTKKSHLNASQEAPATTTTSPTDWQNEVAAPVSFSLNVFLALVLTCVCLKMRNCCCCSAKDSATYIIENQDIQNPQYEEIQLPPTPVPVRVSSECIYYKAQHPNPKMRQY
ncbi:uncharacterized protein LOC102220573 isoform X2 [Xiphophorus maculatus]|uniref:uncharacterized protein LOC102220573 isoform X2 n=1 Tax=Xiphophorus maculatus TaxID=8083 RepID=UPI000C6CF53C|nr:uncharacterized protein LOC102220573 isoform X2 [Xiphophorus maculatus]